MEGWCHRCQKFRRRGIKYIDGELVCSQCLNPAKPDRDTESIATALLVGTLIGFILGAFAVTALGQ